MRLICPNCDAQYEVPDDVMPPEGRDVQCSNCSQTWFQDHPDAGNETLVEVPPAQDDDAKPSSTETDAQLPQLGAVEPPERNTGSGPDDTDMPTAPKRKPMDPAIADVLREEAEFEQKARRSETAGGVESQPDLGLNDFESNRPARNARSGTDQTEGEARSAPIAEATAVSASRRTQLPDIEEINSTLRSNSDRSPGEDAGQTAQVEARETRSFNRGFLFMALLIALFALLYAYAPEVAKAVPQTDPWLSAYVGRVDQGRVWLDVQVKTVLEWLDAMTASSGA